MHVLFPVDSIHLAAPSAEERRVEHWQWCFGGVVAAVPPVEALARLDRPPMGEKRSLMWASGRTTTDDRSGADAMTPNTSSAEEQWKLSPLDCRFETNPKKWWWGVVVIGRGPGPEWGPHLYKDRHLGPLILVFVLPQGVPFRERTNVNNG